MPIRVPITLEILKQLQAHRKRSRVEPTALLNSPDKPDGLTTDTIQNWLLGRVKTARADHLDYVLQEWGHVTPRVLITSEIREKLQACQKRAHVGPAAFLSCKPEKPRGLSAALIYNWLTGETKTARKDHLDYVLKQWEQARKYKPGYVAITPEIIKQLQACWDRSRVGTRAPLHKAPNKPKGLNAGIIESWLDGRAKTARADHLDYVLEQWEQAEHKPKRRQISGADKTARKANQLKPGRVLITPEILEELQTHQERSGVGPISMLRNHPEKRPKGLSAGTINNWLDGSAKTARKEYLDYVLEHWPQAKRVRPDRVLITPEIIEELQTCQERSGIGPVALLSRKPGKPKGLNAGLIYNWLSGKAKTARKDYFDYVLTQWKQAAQHVRQIWHEGESQEFDLELFLKHRGKTPTGNPEASVSLPETLPKPKRPTDKRGYLLDELANNIRKIREKRGISKEALAQACGVTPGTINSWETKKGPFQLQTATCVAQALGSPIEELFPAGVTQGRMKKMPDVSPLHPHRTREELKKLLEQHTTDAPNNIRLIRTACGMGLKDLAERLGTSTSTVYHLEVGKIDTSPQWCLRLGEVFECPPACFKNKAEQGLRSPG